MRCFHCGEEIENELDMVFVDEDGDPVHRGCLKPFNEEKEHFFKVVVHSEELTTAWLLSGCKK